MYFISSFRSFPGFKELILDLYVYFSDDIF